MSRSSLADLVELSTAVDGKTAWVFLASPVAVAGHAAQAAESPIWEAITQHAVAVLSGHESAAPLVLDLASGLGEPACSIARRVKAARVTATDVDEAMLEAARARVKKLGLGKRVKVERMDMCDLSAIGSGSVDLVTCCLGLHLVPLPRVLREVARVLKPTTGRCIGAIWESLPMVDCCLRTMEDLTGEPGSAFMPTGWTDPLAFAGGKMDKLACACGLDLAERSSGHNTITPLIVNLGRSEGAEAWRLGPLAVLPQLSDAPPEELAGFQAAFRRRCERNRMITKAGEVEFAQRYRLLVMRTQRQQTADAASSAAQGAAAHHEPTVTARAHEQGDAEAAVRERTRQQLLRTQRARCELHEHNRQQARQQLRRQPVKRTAAAARGGECSRQQQRRHQQRQRQQRQQQTSEGACAASLQTAAVAGQAGAKVGAAVVAAAVVAAAVPAAAECSTLSSECEASPHAGSSFGTLRLAAFEGQFADKAARMEPVLRRVLIDDCVDEDATALASFLEISLTVSTRHVVRRPQMIGARGCAALRSVVDAERDVSRDSVDQMAQHQLNLPVERLIDLIGRAETEALWRLADEVLAVQRDEAAARARAAGRPVPVATAEALAPADGGFHADLFLRRYTRETRPWIAFHRDVSNVTINVALGDDSAHEGGRLHVILDGRHTTIRRAEGEATAHTEDVMHAVSAMRSGVRYSLIMFFYTLKHEESSLEYQTIPKREL